MIWQLIPESKYMAALKSLPPATQTAQGFLFGALCGTFHGSRRYLGMETAGKVQECLDHEAYCKKHAAWATDITARDAFTECARCWRELSDCWRELTSRIRD
jgi:hypothetical protein